MSSRAWLAMLAALVVSPAGADEPEGLAMSKPVAVTKIHSFAAFEPLPGATLTADDKLMVYYEPTGYTIERTKDGFRALLAQDGKLRKKGRKEALWQKAPMFEFEAKDATQPYRLYMRTDLAIKGLPPGEYELDLTLHDRLAKGTHAVRTVEFKVVPAKEVKPEAEEKGTKEKAKGAG
jgi:hypothetical protein